MKKNELKLKTVSGLSGMIPKTHYCLFFACLILVSISGMQTFHKPGEKYKDIINAVDPDDNPALLIFNLK